MRGRKGKDDYERGGTNVYADLGVRAPGDVLVKAKLVSRIADLIAERGLSKSKAAVVLGIPQPKLSKMLSGQFRGFSECKLMDCLTRLGQDVGIVVRTTSRAKGQGAVLLRLRQQRVVL